jgi:hypothetical protein
MPDARSHFKGVIAKRPQTAILPILDLGQSDASAQAAEWLQSKRSCTMPGHAIPYLIAIVSAFGAFMLALGGSALWAAIGDRKPL